MGVRLSAASLLECRPVWGEPGRILLWRSSGGRTIMPREPPRWSPDPKSR